MPFFKKKAPTKKLKLTKEERQASLKEQLIQKRKAAQARQEFTKFVSMVSCLAIVCAMLIAVVGGVKGAVGGFVGVFCLLLSFKYPWQALYVFWVYLPFGGTITYSVGGGSNPLMQLAKDAFYIPALIGVIQYCKLKKVDWLVPQGLKVPLFMMLGYCLLVLIFINGGQQLFPICKGACNEKPIALGILGLKVFLGYVPLMSCSYYLIQKRADFYRIMRLTVVLILICCGLAFLQYIFLKTGRCKGTVGEGAELFKASLGARCLVGGSLLYSEEQGVIRLPGTFVAPWQWGWYLISSAFFSFAVAFSDRVLIWRLIGMVSMGVTMTLAVLSGQRIALAIVPISFGILLFTTGQLVNLKRFVPILVILGMAIVGALSAYPQIVQERLDSFISRWNAAPPTEFIAQQFEFVQDLSGFLGKGLGRATNSARAMGEVKLIETYFPKVMYEIGPIGLLLFLVLVTTLTVITFKAYKQVKDKNLRGLGAALWTFILVISYNTYYYPLDVDPVAVYYWFVAGMILKLPVLDQEKDEDEEVIETAGKGFKKGGKKGAQSKTTKPKTGQLRRRSPPEDTTSVMPLN
jgi:hypothetical protein